MPKLGTDVAHSLTLGQKIPFYPGHPGWGSLRETPKRDRDHPGVIPFHRDSWQPRQSRLSASPTLVLSRFIPLCRDATLSRFAGMDQNAFFRL